MDFLHLDRDWSVLICTRCQYALVPGAIAAHLKDRYEDVVTRAAVKDCVNAWKSMALQEPGRVQQLYVPPCIPEAAASATLHID